MLHYLSIMIDCHNSRFNIVSISFDDIATIEYLATLFLDSFHPFNIRFHCSLIM